MARLRATANLVGMYAVVNALEDIRNSWGGRPAWEVVAETHYAAYVEFGTWKMGAQPYLRPAVDSTVAGASKYVTMSNSLADLIKRIAEAIASLARNYVPVDTGRLKGRIQARPSR